MTRVKAGIKVIDMFDLSFDHVYWRHLRSSVNRYPRSILDRYSIDNSVAPRLTLDRQSIDISVDSRRQSVDSRIIFDQSITLGRLSTDCWSNVDRESSECRPSIDWDVDRYLIPPLTFVKVWIKALIISLAARVGRWRQAQPSSCGQLTWRLGRSKPAELCRVSLSDKTLVFIVVLEFLVIFRHSSVRLNE